MTYAIVPARGGSVGLPRKNLLCVGGVPLVARAVRTCLQVPGLGGVLCSTDSDEIASVARGAGAWVPWLRPAALATDTAAIVDMLRHAVWWLDGEGYAPEWVVMVQPTSPFVRAETIAAAVAHARAGGYDWVQSVAPVREHPAWMRVLDGDRLRPYDGHGCASRRQELPTVYILTGAVNVYRVAALRAGTYAAAPPGYVCTDGIEGWDIDTAEDYAIAQALCVAGLCHR